MEYQQLVLSAEHAKQNCVYGSLPHQKELPQSSNMYSYSGPKVNLAEASMCAENMLLSHKYGMTKVLEYQAEAFMEPLRQALLIHPRYRSQYEPYCSPVLDCTAIAQTCECYAMLALCETFIFIFFDFFDTNWDLLLAKLSKESLLRIMSGFHHQYKLCGKSGNQADHVKDFAKRLTSQLETPAERLGM